MYTTAGLRYVPLGAKSAYSMANKETTKGAAYIAGHHRYITIESFSNMPPSGLRVSDVSDALDLHVDYCIHAASLLVGLTVLGAGPGILYFPPP